MSNEEETTDLVRFLLYELLQYKDTVELTDDKLQEMMSAKDYDEWAKETGIELWKREVNRMDEGEFKDFCMSHMDDIEHINEVLDGKDFEFI
jgi:hypothetical protein